MGWECSNGNNFFIDGVRAVTVVSSREWAVGFGVADEGGGVESEILGGD